MSSLDASDGSSDASVARQDVDVVSADGARDGTSGDTAPVIDAARAADAIEPDAEVVNTGRCGDPVRACLCACAGSAACQQTCVNTDETCSSCLYDSLGMCCPMESSVFETCILDSMCETDACVLERCGGQYASLQNCARRREREPACLVHVQRCLGDDYPSIRCPASM
ncbi:MAG: hypothetical protein Q8Q09_24490 [Deltaproteobacteria bacterium]|nr:hypothetical protein [Deltaproteobacteria bacterium]